MSRKEREALHDTFSKTLKRLRNDAHLSQQQLSDLLHVSRSTVASWETGLRLPSAVMILRIADCLSADPAALMKPGEETAEKPCVILADPDPVALSGSLSTLQQVFPNADVALFSSLPDPLEFARSSPAALAFLETELGTDSGLALCRELLKLNPRTNVIFLTSSPEYALEAWTTGACGYLMKPLTPESLRRQLAWLRYPVRGLE